MKADSVADRFSSWLQQIREREGYIHTQHSVVQQSRSHDRSILAVQALWETVTVHAYRYTRM